MAHILHMTDVKAVCFIAQNLPSTNSSALHLVDPAAFLASTV